MLYKKKAFSVPATEGKGDCSKGHCGPDRKGRCLRCGIEIPAATTSATIGRATAPEYGR